jgi:hypothetical protein
MRNLCLHKEDASAVANCGIAALRRYILLLDFWYYQSINPIDLESNQTF